MPDAFICRMCGQCCQGQGGIVLTTKDIHRLAAGLNISRQKMLASYAMYEQIKPVLTCQADGTCVFFQADCGCTVHEHKPDVCRAWPFFRGNLEDEASWRMAQEYCPGINPAISHLEFVRQGLIYVRSHDLVYPQAPNNPSALITGHLLERHAALIF
jgi:hypothetical protein